MTDGRLRDTLVASDVLLVGDEALPRFPLHLAVFTNGEWRLVVTLSSFLCHTVIIVM